MAWQGFDGRIYTRDQWVAHVAQTTIFPDADKIVEHSTGIPTLAQWLTFNEADYVKNVQTYYENALGWAHGPHLFASYKDIIGFSNLSARGTHASCYNYDSIGGECGINRGTENWQSGPGAMALENQHFAFAALFVKMGLKPSPATYLPHSACLADGHSVCPVPDFERYRDIETAAIVAFMNTLGDKLPVDPAKAAQATIVYAPISTPSVGSIAWCQAALNKAGASPQIAVDGDNGPATRAAVYAFQARTHIQADGQVGPQTIGMLKFYA
jgi:hypothetical protein